MSGSWFSDEARLTQVRSGIKEEQKEGETWEIETIVLSGEPETGGSLRKGCSELALSGWAIARHLSEPPCYLSVLFFRVW